MPESRNVSLNFAPVRTVLYPVFTQIAEVLEQYTAREFSGQLTPEQRAVASRLRVTMGKMVDGLEVRLQPQQAFTMGLLERVPRGAILEFAAKREYAKPTPYGYSIQEVARGILSQSPQYSD
jgi:hypothetical protein